jgi:hypothetical protein
MSRVSNDETRYATRRCFTLWRYEWEVLKDVAIEQGFRSRNLFINTTIRQIIADHQQSKNPDAA